MSYRRVPLGLAWRFCKYGLFIEDDGDRYYEPSVDDVLECMRKAGIEIDRKGDIIDDIREAINKYEATKK